MLLHSKFKVPRRPLCRCLSLLIGAFAFTAVSSPRQASGQQYQQPPVNNVYRSPIIQRPIVQSPADQSQIYRGPTYQRRVYQGPGYYRDLGRLIQQPPASNPTQAPVGFQAVPPVARPIPQAVQPNAQQALAAEQAAYNAEKLALVEKLLEKYKLTAAENQGALEQLNSLKQQNVELLQRMSELDKTSKSFQTEVLVLQKELAAAGQSKPEGMQEADQLKAKYEGVVRQVSELESQVKSLSDDKANYLQQISNLKAGQKNVLNLEPAKGNQAELAEKNQQLTADNLALGNKNMQLNQEYLTLKDQYRDLSQQQQLARSDNRMLSDRMAELKSSFNGGQVSDVAEIDPRATEPVPSSALAQPSVDLSAYETKISQLTRKNRQLSESNADFKRENRTLSRQVSSVKNQRGQETRLVDSSAIASASLPTGLSTAAATDTGEKGGWGVFAWLIPFLAIGLGIAFFVIIKEELHRPPATAIDRPGRQD